MRAERSPGAGRIGSRRFLTVVAVLAAAAAAVAAYDPDHQRRLIDRARRHRAAERLSPHLDEVESHCTGELGSGAEHDKLIVGRIRKCVWQRRAGLDAIERRLGRRRPRCQAAERRCEGCFDRRAHTAEVGSSGPHDLCM